MKFAVKQDIEAPIAFVFAHLTDFDAWERSAMRRGADVSRTDTLRQPGAGMTWRAAFPYRGKRRQVDARLLKLAAPGKIDFAAVSTAIEADVQLDLAEMSARRTRMHITLEVTPRNLTARLFIQSIRLARARMDRKFAFRVAQVVTDIEAAYRGHVAA